jgi:alkylated DNA repair protein (DNA oxidative demethylase)
MSVDAARLIPRAPEVIAPGAVLLPGWLDVEAQAGLARAVGQWVGAAGGLHHPRMPRGGVMSVGMVGLGWHWRPYRYARTVDDQDGRPVAALPPPLVVLSARAVADAAGVDPQVMAAGPGSPAPAFRPDVALVNWYGPGARMGMHVDRDEASPAPVVSISLGDSCVFRFGTPAGRGRPWTDLVLESGDLVVFGGPSRRAYHGVPKVLPATADPALTGGGGRWNITVRETGLPERP